MATIAKINGITWASMAKRNGIAVASIAKIDGVNKPTSGGAVALSFIGYATEEVAASASWTKTYASQSIGAADASRHIVVCAMVRSNGIISDLTCSIAGVSATPLVYKGENNAGFNTEIFIAAVPTGTTGDVVIGSVAKSKLWTAIAVYRVLGANATPYDTATHANASTTIDVEIDGCIIGCMSSSNPGPAATCTGITEDFDFRTSPINYGDVSAGGSYAATSTEADRTVRINGSSSYDVASFIALSPA